MGEFFAALTNPNVPFLRYAFIAGLLGSAAFGVVGSYVTVKRVSSMAGAIAHSVLAGIGVSLYVAERFGVAWFTPTVGAMVAALIAALVIGAVSVVAKEREDTIIGAIWAVGMAVGILFIARTPGYVNPMTYLFGNILVVTRLDLLIIAILDVLVVVVGMLLYRQFQAVSFDEEFAAVRGVQVHVYYFVLLVLSAMTIVLLANIVGIIMVIALLTIPPAVGGIFSRTLLGMMAVATVSATVFTAGGMVISYAADLPSGSVIIVFAAAVYLLLAAARVVVRRVRGAS
jgi:zinc transport system permease protein